MRKCFVMQPFDGGVFDKRYESVFAPAISDAGVEPYRVDRDPSVSIPIQEIENGLRDADICFADITTDNPNVWFELGFALAMSRDVVLVCSDERKTRFPFDVQHRSIIKYNTGAPQDYEQLKDSITKRIKAILKKNEELGKVFNNPVVKDTEGLNQHELVALVTVMQNSFLTSGSVTGIQVQRDMNKAGFTDIAVSIALKTLLTKGMIGQVIEQDYNGNPYTAYNTTDKGDEWLITNQDKLTLTYDKPPNDSQPESNDIPF